jgi:Spy/CpxP family protein refolding chaperone
MQQETKVEENKVEMPDEFRNRFLKEQLGLDEGTKIKFRRLNRDYNQDANQIMHELSLLRSEMVQQLGNKNCDTLELRNIAKLIGEKHKELKLATVHFYLDMKTELNEEQQTKLYDLFSSLLQKDEEVKTPKGRKGWGNGNGPGGRNQ